MSINYEVHITAYAEKHYIKSFSKKYKKMWDTTRAALLRELQNFAVILEKSIAEIILRNNNESICKVEFRVAGTKDSRHGSGNRCIVAKNDTEKKITVLLVYHKNDLGEGQETEKWKKLIRENYKEYAYCV